MIQNTVHQLSSQRATCKQWSTALAVVILLVGALGHVDGAKLLWAAAPIVLLGLAEAGYSAQERRVAEHLKSRKGNANDAMVLLPREAAGASLWRTIAAATAISIWPFYTGLAAIVAVGGGAVDLQRTAVEERATGHSQHVVQPTMSPSVVASAKPSSGGCGSGGCGGGGGAGGGCGSGGCGSSGGKACGCSSGGAKATTTAQPKRPQQQAQQPQQQQILQTAAGPRALNTVPPNAISGNRVAPARPPAPMMNQRVIAPQIAPQPTTANGGVVPAVTVPDNSSGEALPPQASSPATIATTTPDTTAPAQMPAAVGGTQQAPTTTERATTQGALSVPAPAAAVPNSSNSVAVPKPSNAKP